MNKMQDAIADAKTELLYYQKGDQNSDRLDKIKVHLKKLQDLLEKL